MSTKSASEGSPAEPGVTVVLFDIDGTLLTTAGAARAAFNPGLTEAAGRSISPDGYSFSGRTDPQIARDILTSHGMAGAPLEAAIRRRSVSTFAISQRAGTSRRLAFSLESRIS